MEGYTLIFLLGIAALEFQMNIITIIVFDVLLLSSIVYPLPHEYLLLVLIKRWPKRYNIEPYKKWLVTTPALIRKLNLEVQIYELEDRQIAAYQRIQSLKNYELFPYEITRYYISKLNVLFEIGAIKELKEELVRLQKYKDQVKYILLQVYVAFSDGAYGTMYELCEKLYTNEFVDKNIKIVALINEVCAAQNSGDTERYYTKIKRLEYYYENEGIWIPELITDLMLFYDSTGLKLKADDLAMNLEHNTWKSIHQYLVYKDILLQHYKTIGEGHKCRRLILEMQRYINEHEKDDKRRAFSNLRFLSLYFEYDLNWQEYSRYIYTNCDYFMNLSTKVGLELIKQTNRMNQLAYDLYGLQLNEEKMIYLYKQFENKIEQYNKEIDAKLATLDDAFLYYKRELLNMKAELVSASNTISSNIIELSEKRERLFERMIELCEKNANSREELHMVTVYIDEIITSHKNLLIDMTDSLALRERQDVVEYLRKWPSMKNKVLNMLEHMTQMLEKNNYDVAYSYYVLYAAYLYKEIENKDRSEYFLHEFEKYKIDYHCFALSTQKIYLSLKESSKQCNTFDDF